MNNNIFAGIDIGSRTVKFVLIKKNEIIYQEIIDNSFNTVDICKRFIGDFEFESIIATGYGRTLLEINENISTISEIKAFATGVNKIINGDKVILDIGGQDTKFIKIKNGKVIKFEMNDRCAAGTGKFFEIMAKTLSFNIDDFSEIPLKNININISSMCAVFAESEVTSLLAKGEDRTNIAIALHKSVVKRIIGKLQNFITDKNEHIIFCGGCAKNKLLVKLIENELGMSVVIPEYPQIIGAYGAALVAAMNSGKNFKA